MVTNILTSTESARLIVSTLYNAGVREAVICPGSRNAPLSFALLALAEAKQIRLYVRIDERSAAFLALGLAIASGTPVPICVTSGTAVANLFPAIVEANYAQVPVLVLSANQPLTVSECGESQVIRQYGIFGDHVRCAVHICESATADEIQGALELSLCRALDKHYPGPVQLDIAFIEPLMPPEDSMWVYHPKVNEKLSIPVATTVFSKPGIVRVGPHILSESNIEVNLGIPTVVVVGSASWPLHTPLIPEELRDVPTIAEPTATTPRFPLHPWAIPLVNPQQVVVLGRPTLHREVLRLIDSPYVNTISLADPLLWQGKPGSVNHFGNSVYIQSVCHPEWLQLCTKAHEITVEVITKKLALLPQTTGLEIAAAIGEIASEYSSILLGPSNSIRDIALAAGPLGTDSLVVANRGASGIDGNLATVLGLSYIHSPTLAFIGDLTFLHDITSLVIGPEEYLPESLTIVVANDNGGGIFSTLEQGDPKYSSKTYGAGAERIFSTSHSASIADICRGLNIDYSCIVGSQIKSVLSQPCEGIRVVEISCSRTILRDVHQSVRVELRHIWEQG